MVEEMATALKASRVEGEPAKAVAKTLKSKAKKLALPNGAKIALDAL